MKRARGHYWVESRDVKEVELGDSFYLSFSLGIMQLATGGTRADATSQQCKVEGQAGSVSNMERSARWRQYCTDQ